MPDPRSLPRGWTLTQRGFRVSPEQRQYLSAGLQRGLSIAETLRQLRAGGLSITTQAAYDVAREVLGGFRTAGRANRATDATTFAHGEYQQIGRRMPDKYRVVGEINLGDANIEGRNRFSAFVYSNKLLTVGELKAAIFNQFSQLLAKYGQQFDDAGISLSEDDINFTTFESFLS